ncbi:Protein yipf5 [Perkinsus olseni]|uniref:Protein yipf5 n=2 Tax=Perkinsus olseni TaxID=32597 RepID=A0A7J6NT14_PEROL|nr:Protein yipf5 [Perkinsus olseni]
MQPFQSTPSSHYIGSTSGSATGGGSVQSPWAAASTSSSAAPGGGAWQGGSSGEFPDFYQGAAGGGVTSPSASSMGGTGVLPPRQPSLGGGSMGGAGPQHPTPGGGSMGEFDTDDDDLANEPPLLEELGIDLDAIAARIKSILFFRGVSQNLMQDTDLGGPLLIAAAFGTMLVLAGKVHFGYIYGLGMVGCLGIYLLTNVMSPKKNGIDLYTTMSILGYGLLPVVFLAAAAVFFKFTGAPGIIVAVLNVLWCTLTASRFLEAAVDMQNQRWLIAYPVAMVGLSISLFFLYVPQVVLSVPGALLYTADYPPDCAGGIHPQRFRIDGFVREGQCIYATFRNDSGTTQIENFGVILKSDGPPPAAKMKVQMNVGDGNKVSLETSGRVELNFDNDTQYFNLILSSTSNSFSEVNEDGLIECNIQGDALMGFYNGPSDREYGTGNYIIKGVADINGVGLYSPYSAVSTPEKYEIRQVLRMRKRGDNGTSFFFAFRVDLLGGDPGEEELVDRYQDDVIEASLTF